MKRPWARTGRIKYVQSRDDLYTNEFKSWEFSKANAVGLEQQSDDEAADTREGPVGLPSAEQVQQPWLQTGKQLE